eukprot:COSAG01_NODE_6449_length_3661_cov_3.663953_2_plen_72_part_00
MASAKVLAAAKAASEQSIGADVMAVLAPEGGELLLRRVPHVHTREEFTVCRRDRSPDPVGAPCTPCVVAKK